MREVYVIDASGYRVNRNGAVRLENVAQTANFRAFLVLEQPAIKRKFVDLLVFFEFVLDIPDCIF
jgi:hypothetical protein